ncbi:MAG: nucleotidyl transferase AbiEii/AbiGii toxin family protein [Gemmatimonadetes bacterium]|nr:nucleotidyl transferase AbiEii/AbiGii toxin family protein [Gemmatimonadota bacterium]
MADGLKLKLSRAHHAALADFSDVMQELLVQDWSSLVLGGGTVLAMHWNHRHSTDLDFIVEEDEPLHAGALRNRLEVLQRQGRIDVWRYARRRSVMLTAGGVRLSFVFEGVDAGVPADGRTAMDIRCESPGSILTRKLFGRVLDSGQMVSRDFYDFAWAALHRPTLWAQVSGRLLPEERSGIARECRSIARSRKGRRTGRPVLRPSDPELARTVWATCARLLEAADGASG